MAAGSSEIQFDAAVVLDAARNAAGLTDFGPDDFHPAL